MSFSPPAAPPRPPRGRRRWGLILAVAAVLAVIAYFAFSSIGNALVYYLTPTELAQRTASDPAVYQQPVRLGGLVKEGSISGTATDLRFVLTDGSTDITVHSAVAPTRSFREGAGAVVEGQLQPDGTFEASQVLVKHDENYVAPSDGAIPSHVSEP